MSSLYHPVTASEPAHVDPKHPIAERINEVEAARGRLGAMAHHLGQALRLPTERERSLAAMEALAELEGLEAMTAGVRRALETTLETEHKA